MERSFSQKNCSPKGCAVLDFKEAEVKQNCRFSVLLRTGALGWCYLNLSSFVSLTTTVTATTIRQPPRPRLVWPMPLLLSNIVKGMKYKALLKKTKQNKGIKHNYIQTQSVDRIRGSMNLGGIINTPGLQLKLIISYSDNRRSRQQMIVEYSASDYY